MTILVVAEHDNKELKKSTLNTIEAAKKIDSDIDLLVAGSNCEGVADKACNLPDIAKVLVADKNSYKDFLAENMGTLISKIGEGYTHILAPATSNGKNYMPRAAALLDSAQISEIISVISDNTFERPIYAGNCIATVKTSDSIKVITVRTTAFDECETEGGSASKEFIDDDNDLGISLFINEELAESDRPELTSADIVISGGRGMQNGENFSLLEGIADKLGAAIGASRAAVDSGFVPNDMQVGQTGKIVAPNLYIAVGISGAIQHLAGMKDSKVIVAINKDEEAPIFQVADYGLVSDLFEALPELEAKL